MELLFRHNFLIAFAVTILTHHFIWGRYAKLIAALAQLVEQFTRNDQVNGSIPLGGSIS